MVSPVWNRGRVKGLSDDRVERLEKYAEERWGQNEEEEHEEREAKHELQREVMLENEELEAE